MSIPLRFMYILSCFVSPKLDDCLDSDLIMVSSYFIFLLSGIAFSFIISLPPFMASNEYFSTFVLQIEWFINNSTSWWPFANFCSFYRYHVLVFVSTALQIWSCILWYSHLSAKLYLNFQQIFVARYHALYVSPSHNIKFITICIPLNLNSLPSKTKPYPS